MALSVFILNLILLIGISWSKHRKKSHQRLYDAASLNYYDQYTYDDEINILYQELYDEEYMLNRLYYEHMMMDDYDMMAPNANYDMMRGQGGRPPCPYPAAPTYRFDLSAVAPNGIDMARHHIIPWRILKHFWNACVTRKYSKPIGTILKAVLASSGTDGWNGAAALGGGFVTVGDIDTLARQNVGNINIKKKQKANLAAPTGWRDVMKLYCWMPGNLFYGPRGAPGTGDAGTANREARVTAPGRIDDPGSNFEVKAKTAVGSKKYKSMHQIDTAMEAFIANPASISENDVNKIAELLVSIGLKRDAEITPVNAAAWKLIQHQPADKHLSNALNNGPPFTVYELQ